jgi:hypothetical protein
MKRFGNLLPLIHVVAVVQEAVLFIEGRLSDLELNCFHRDEFHEQEINRNAVPLGDPKERLMISWIQK